MNLWRKLRNSDELEDLRTRVAVLSDPEMTDLRLSNGALNLEATGLLVKRMATAVASQFHEHGAKNYIEYNFQTAEGERYAVTVQKASRPSPHELRMAAEAEAKRLRELVYENKSGSETSTKAP